MDGYTATETIRRQLPYFLILMLSSDNPPPADILIQKGIDEWIDKACGPEYLHQRIAEWGDTRTFSVVKRENQIVIEREMPMDAQHAQEIKELQAQGLIKVKFDDISGAEVVVHKNI